MAAEAVVDFIGKDEKLEKTLSDIRGSVDSLSGKVGGGLKAALGIFSAEKIKGMSGAILRAAGETEEFGQRVKNLGGFLNAVELRLAAGLIPALETFSSTFVEFFSAGENVVKNFGQYVDIMWETAKLGGVRFYEDFKHFFIEELPAYITWLNDNWGNLFSDMADITSTVFSNMWENAKNFFENIAKWIKGEETDWHWTGLTEGFKSSLEELPKIAGRTKTDVEKELEASIAKNRADFGNKGEQIRRDNQRSAAPIDPEKAKQVGDAIKGVTDWAKNFNFKGTVGQVAGAVSNVGGATAATLADVVGDGLKKVVGIGQKKEEFKSTTEDLAGLYKRVSGAALSTPELELAKKNEGNTAKTKDYTERVAKATEGLWTVFKTGGNIIGGAFK